MTTQTQHRIPARALWIGALFAVEMVAIVAGFQLLASVECHLTQIETACRGLRGALVRGLSLGVMLGLYLWAMPAARAGFARIVAAREGGGGGWAVAHLLGLVAIFAPLALVPEAGLNAGFHWIFPVLIGGAGLAITGGVLWLAEPAGWRDWMRDRRAALAALGALALVLPDMGEAIAPIWYWQALTDVTFMAVAFLLWLLTEAPMVMPERLIIGANGFNVAVADSCSGVEGFALVTVFLGLYAVLFRDGLRMARFWAVVWPVALILSWVLNVLRIAALILIGAYASPELAVNGFHSFAGWLFFTLLAIGILVAVSRIGWLQTRADTPARAVPLAEDESAARIVPFIAFMLSGVMAQAFWAAPVLAYPFQALVMAAALWCVRRPLCGLWARPSGLSLMVGGGIGLLWVLSAPGAGPAEAALVGLGQVALLAWIAMRLIGTVLLVPVIEELFFRGYVQARIDDGTGARRVLAVAVSAALFALLHGRWVEAGLAGIALSLVYLHRGRLVDAVAAHAVANAGIAVVAAWRGDWALI